MDLGYYVLNTYHPERDGTAADLYARYLEQIAAAAAAGFGTVWCTEHHFHAFGGMTPNPAVLLTAVSQRAPGLRLGTSVSILPLHHPLRLAEDYAMVDVLSGGRLEFGAGRGMSTAGYTEFGLDYSGTSERVQEALALIDQAWRTPSLTFDGQFYQCQAVTVLPRPVQQPRPPIWVTASLSPDTFRWVGAAGYDLMILPWLFPSAIANLADYRGARAAAGHAGPGRVMAMYPTHLADSSAAARAAVAPTWAWWHAQIAAGFASPTADRLAMPEHVRILGDLDFLTAERRVPFGTPDAALATVRWLEQLGVTHLGLTFHFGGLDHASALRAIALWGREVVPAMR